MINKIPRYEITSEIKKELLAIVSCTPEDKIILKIIPGSLSVKDARYLVDSLKRIIDAAEYYDWMQYEKV